MFNQFQWVVLIALGSSVFNTNAEQTVSINIQALHGTWRSAKPAKLASPPELELRADNDAIVFQRTYLMKPAALFKCNRDGVFQAEVYESTKDKLVFKLRSSQESEGCNGVQIECLIPSKEQIWCEWFDKQKFILIKTVVVS